MTIDEEKLIHYALDMLDAAERKVVQRALSHSPELQRELVSIREALQLFARTDEPVQTDDRLRNLVLESTRDDAGRFAGFVQRFSNMFDVDRDVARKLLDKIDASDHDWERSPFLGVTLMKFAGGPRVGSATCGIVQVAAGTLFPAHQHRDEERILVLQGKAIDDQGKLFAPGDMYRFPAGSRHSFRILGDKSFVFAVVLQGKNKWLVFKTLLDALRIGKR